MEISREDLEGFIEPMIEIRDSLKKEIGIAKKYREQSLIMRRPDKIELADQEYKILDKIITDFMNKILIKLDQKSSD